MDMCCIKCQARNTHLETDSLDQMAFFSIHCFLYRTEILEQMPTISIVSSQFIFLLAAVGLHFHGSNISTFASRSLDYASTAIVVASPLPSPPTVNHVGTGRAPIGRMLTGRTSRL